MGRHPQNEVLRYRNGGIGPFDGGLWALALALAGLGWAGLSWAGLGWAGLHWACATWPGSS